MTDIALAALRLYEAWKEMPADRGGPNGPRGKAHKAFDDAKEVALAEADAPTSISAHLQTEMAVAVSLVRDGGLRSGASVLRDLARWLERFQASRELAVDHRMAPPSRFVDVYPAPWRLADREVVDRDGCNVQDFDDTPEDREFWRGVVDAVNAGVVSPPAADPINLQGSGPAPIAPRVEINTPWGKQPAGREG